MNREVANLIADEASVAIDRIAEMANGELVPDTDLRPNTRVPSRAERSAKTERGGYQIPNTRIYSVAPNQSAIEFLVNHTLGMPGAKIEVITTDEDGSRRIQGAKDRENGVVVKDHSVVMLACEQQLKDFLPTAIDRLMELAAGVTVQYMHKGQSVTITHKPNAKSIDYITSRTEGRFASVLTDLRNKFENPNLDYPYTVEDFEKMTQAEREALYDCALRNVNHFPDKPSGFDDNDDEDDANINLPSNSHPFTGYGRGDGGEGYNAGAEGYNTDRSVTISELPEFITIANKRLADFLPTAITHLKRLAIGAQTIIDSETEQKAIDFGPDLKANMFFVNRFLGAPTASLKIENIKPAMDAAALAKLAADHPGAVAKYGSIEAAIKAKAQRMAAKERGYE